MGGAWWRGKEKKTSGWSALSSLAAEKFPHSGRGGRDLPWKGIRQIKKREVHIFTVSEGKPPTEKEKGKQQGEGPSRAWRTKPMAKKSSQKKKEGKNNRLEVRPVGPRGKKGDQKKAEWERGVKN